MIWLQIDTLQLMEIIFAMLYNTAAASISEEDGFVQKWKVASWGHESKIVAVNLLSMA